MTCLEATLTWRGFPTLPSLENTLRVPPEMSLPLPEGQGRVLAGRWPAVGSGEVVGLLSPELMGES